jgi:hypothetical protein
LDLFKNIKNKFVQVIKRVETRNSSYRHFGGWNYDKKKDFQNS